MSNIVVQRIRDANQVPPLMKETNQLLDQVRSRAFELFDFHRVMRVISRFLIKNGGRLSALL